MTSAPHDAEASPPASSPDQLPTELSGDLTAEFNAAPFRLDIAAVSDVGRVRKDNQDSGYAGPWLLSVCDGVGGAVGGDIASSTVLDRIRLIDRQPVGDLLAKVFDALKDGHRAVADLIAVRPALTGTSTTAVVALFDGHQLAFGHVGDSRAYLMRAGLITQLTHDHTFVQTLIDEGRITEEEAQFHPHRNLILRAVDGVHELEPDLFLVDLALGDRIMLCSDGVSGSLDSGRLADILSAGSPDFAATELVRLSMDAGSTDNVTSIVADVLPVDASAELPEPIVVGAAAAATTATKSGRGFLGHRSSDTGELPRVKDEVPAPLPPGITHAIPSDPIDPEELRYAPRPPRRFLFLRRSLATLMVLGLAWIAAAAAWSWSQHQYFVGVADEHVAIYRGVQADIPGLTLHSVFEATDLSVEQLAEWDAQRVRDGIPADSLADARRSVGGFAQVAQPSQGQPSQGQPSQSSAGTTTTGTQ